MLTSNRARQAEGRKRPQGEPPAEGAAARPQKSAKPRVVAQGGGGCAAGTDEQGGGQEAGADEEWGYDTDDSQADFA